MKPLLGRKMENRVNKGGPATEGHAVEGGFFRMKLSEDRILILGAGWRVQRFILPALELAGARTANITILRRKSVPVIGFEEASVITDVSRCDETPDLVVNCLPSGELITLGTEVFSTFPSSVHFWDTASSKVPFRLLLKAHSDPRLQEIRSTEDFPMLPNVLAMEKHLGGISRLRFANVGIPIHFLSFMRTLLSDQCGKICIFRRHGDDFASRKRFSISRSKDFSSARITAGHGTADLTDNLGFLDSFSGGGLSDGEVVRLVDDVSVKYRIDGNVYSSFEINARIRAEFLDDASRKSAHELDKVFALRDIFLSPHSHYSARNSIADTIAGKCLKKFGICMVRPGT
ncbi:hypothetical protein HKCCSP123_07820 [Rhodobacterales bacterium HKCCSP123]|nr:hypothetical protein [Rhodobacterales bacterium HKCCSP123]